MLELASDDSAEQQILPTNSSSQTDDSSLPDVDLLKTWTSRSSSRVGVNFQVDDLPVAGNYNDDGQCYERVWDPKRAQEKGLLNFVHLYCPSNKKEFALALLHKGNYEINGFWDALEKTPPLDDTIWTDDDKDTFVKLMTETKHDIVKIAQRLGKSVGNCLTVHYSYTGCNVRITRSARRNLSRRKHPHSKERMELNFEAPGSVKESNDQNYEQILEGLCDETFSTSTLEREEMVEGSRKGLPKKSTVLENDKLQVLSSSKVTPEKITVPHDCTIVMKETLQQAVLATGEKDGKNTTPVARDTIERRMTRSTSSRIFSVKPSVTVNIEKEDEAKKSQYSDILKRQTRSARRKQIQNSVHTETFTLEIARVKKRRRTERKDVVGINQKKDPEKVWDTHFKSLLQFKKNHGHCLIPKVYRENQPLSSWVFRQRSEYRKKQENNCKSTYLTDERHKKLQKHGFAWRTKCTKEQSDLERKNRSGAENKRWEMFFHQLLDYKKKNGNCLVPKIFKENQTLSAWVFKQRSQMKLRKDGKESRLTDERANKLNDVGFVWDAKSDEEWKRLDQLKKKKQADILWDQHYNKLVAFKKEFGHTRIPKRYNANQALSTWVFRQRAHYRALRRNSHHSLTERRQRKLNQIGFEFELS